MYVYHDVISIGMSFSISPTAIKCIIFGSLKTETNPRPTLREFLTSYAATDESGAKYNFIGFEIVD